MASISYRIRQLREERHLTQEEFGKLFGIVKSTVSLYEHGKSTPNDQIKTAICKFFDVSLDYLLGLSDDRKPHFSDTQETSPPTKKENPPSASEDGREAEFISMYRQLTDAEKSILTSQIKGILSARE